MTDTTKTTKRPPTRKPDPATAILAEVKAARKAIADDPMPLAGGQRPAKGLIHHQGEANRWRSIEMSRRHAETPGWDASLLAALYGALAEAEPMNARAGLVRLAALTVAAVEDIDREAV
ncbi:hypothetical protein [Streptomyces sp. CC77]|uniref:hypothetical protein n=1 Tax=Streptomyces sp. CC77 TaxID=1906739 RepID=UPI0008DD55E8|nr:hypothetical protein [Streptomyces sp. CC77]OII68259.1 hypothetical protein BJP39_00390 [Streptomyces sp. CC77]